MVPPARFRAVVDIGPAAVATTVGHADTYAEALGIAYDVAATTPLDARNPRAECVERPVPVPQEEPADG